MEPIARALLPWLATYLIHSTLLLGGALLLARWVRSPVVREALWKGALAGALATASVRGLLAPLPLGFERLELAFAGAELPPEPPGPPSRAVAAESGRANGARPLQEERPEQDAAPPTALVLPRGGGETAAPFAPDADARPVPWATLAVGGWLAVAATLLARLARVRWRTRRLFAGRRPVRDTALLATLARLRTRAGRPRRVRLTSCGAIGSPVALGTREICVPERACRELSAGELEGMLAHELAHLRRRDPMWLVLAHVLERLFCFQPLNRVVRRRLQADVEVLCDDWAAEETAAPAELARCLARVAGWMEASPPRALAPGMADSPSGLVARVERLLGPRRAARHRAGAAVPLGVAAALGAVAWAAPGVTAAGAQDDESGKSTLVRVVVEGATYRLGDGAPEHLEPLLHRLRARLADRPDGRVAIALAPGAAAEHARPLVEALGAEGVHDVVVEGGSREANELRRFVFEREAITVRIEVVVPGTRLHADTGEPWDGDGPFRYGGRELAYRAGSRELPDLDALERALVRHYGDHRRAPVTIDAREGVIYQDVVDVLDRVVLAGFTHISFAQGREEWVRRYDARARGERDGERASLEGKIRDFLERARGAELALRADGSIVAGTDVLFDPRADGGREDPYSGVRAWLELSARRMEKAPLHPGSTLLVADEPLLLRLADDAPFVHVQRVMELCGGRDVFIRKVELAGPALGAIDRIPTWLPVDPGEADVAPGERIEVIVRPRSDGPGGERRVEYHMGPYRTRDLGDLERRFGTLPRAANEVLRIVVDARQGTLAKDVLGVLLAARAAGIEDVGFVGAYGDR